MLSCSLTRVVTVHAQHRYYRDGWTADENRRRFGAADEGNGHGHLYRIEVTVRGPLDPETQMVIDLPAFDRILTDEIARPLDGRHLNEAVPPFAAGEQLPTCEALAAWCWSRLARRLPPQVHLDRVRVAEDPTLWADCTSSA